MKNNENIQLLTTDLYQKISSDKSSKIVELKNLRAEVSRGIIKDNYDLKLLKEEREALDKKIKIFEKTLIGSKKKKLKLTKEMGKQKRLANKINRLATKEDCYVDVRSFYPEENIKTR